jgi:NAD(P)-dependent dehydrogenase (short-subunit alcohol dehydrogenase family)
MDISGKTALVTGATRGIGRATAHALVGAGMNVVLTARNGEEAGRVARELTQAGPGRAMGLACDVRDLTSVEGVVNVTLGEFGALDLLVANAGVGGRASIVDLEPEFWHEVMNTNLTGAFHSVKVAVPALIESEGMIITIGSLAGANFFAGGAAYNASKFGLLGFTQAVMLDLRDHGVRVSTIMPGSVATTFADRAGTDQDAWKLDPADIAETVLYLFRMPARALPSKVEIRPARTSLS